MAIAALVADLIFESKIAATAKQLDVPVRVVRTPEEALSAATDASGVIVDLSVSPGDPLQFVRDVKRARPDVPVVAFVSHVEVELARQAREAGADDVLPKSEFTEKLGAILRRLSGAAEAG